MRATIAGVLVLFVLGAVCGCGGGSAVPRAEAVKPAEPAPWYEREIEAFEARDRVAMPTPGGVLFIGSSSIRMWEGLEKAMAPARVVQRGFGGSKTGEVLAVFDRIVLPYEPSIIVYYCGDNDLGNDNTDSRAAAEGFIAFDRRARSHWPSVRIFYLPIKPSIARWNNWPAMEKANGLVRDYCIRTPGAAYLETVAVLLGGDGKPDPAFFREDGLHLNQRGYERWLPIVRGEVLRAWMELSATKEPAGR